MSEVPTKKSKLGEGNDELWRKSAPNCLSLLRTMFDNKIHTDVTVKVESGSKIKEIECHSILLAAHSPVFSAMLSPEWITDKHGARRTVTLRDDDPDALIYFLKLMYCDWNEEHFKSYDIPEGLTPELAVGVLSLAHKYLACYIIRLAEHLIHCYLSKKSAADTVKLYLLLKSLHICDRGQIARKSFRTVENCLLADGENLFSSDAILQVYQSDLVDITKKHFLRCSEEAVFNGCLRWGREECKLQKLPDTGKNIRSVLGDVIKFIRFPLLDKLTLTNKLVPEKILTDEEMVDLLAYVVRKDLESVENHPLRFCIQERISRTEIFALCRLDGDFVSKDLVDFSSPHGFEMSFSKKIKLIGMTVFIGKSSSNTFKINVELEIDKETRVCDFPGTKGNERNWCYVNFHRPFEIPANILTNLKFKITGGKTMVAQELVEENTKEITYLDSGTMVATFKSSPNIANGLNQIPILMFLSDDD